MYLYGQYLTSCGCHNTGSTGEGGGGWPSVVTFNMWLLKVQREVGIYQRFEGNNPKTN